MWIFAAFCDNCLTRLLRSITRFCGVVTRPNAKQMQKPIVNQYLAETLGPVGQGINRATAAKRLKIIE
jgi:hypothetical protein